MDVSIIIPTRDRLWSLPKAIDSCRSGSIKVQIIVVDDASNDGTWDWLKTQPDVIAICGDGWGKPWAVNKALRVVTGKYLRFLDSDDWLNANATENQFAVAETESVDLVVSGVTLYEEERRLENKPWVDTDDLIAQQLGETYASHYSAFLFRTSFVCDIPHRTLFPSSNCASRDDRCFMLEVALRKPRFAVCRSETLCHRHHARTRLQSADGVKGIASNIQYFYILKQILALLERRHELTMRRRRAAVRSLWPLAHWIGYTHPRVAEDIAKWVYNLVPDFEPPDGGLLGRCYSHLGFSITERLLRLRRSLLRPVRQVFEFD